MTIADLIANVRVELADKTSSRWTNSDLLGFVKKAVRRLNHILVRNDIQAGKSTHKFDTEAEETEYDLPADFATDIGIWRDDGLRLEKLNEARYFGAIAGSETVAYYILDKICVYNTPASVRTLTLVYWPLVDTSTYTVATSLPWDGRFDDILEEYVSFRAKNVDEMSVDEEKAILADMENNVLATFGSVAPTIVRQRGWLP